MKPTHLMNEAEYMALIDEFDALMLAQSEPEEASQWWGRRVDEEGRPIAPLEAE